MAKGKAYEWNWTGFVPNKESHAVYAGAYVITCIETKEFYIGGTTNAYARLICHHGDLQRNEHPIPRFQKLFDLGYRFHVTFHLVGIMGVDGDYDHLKELSRDAEQVLLDGFKNNPLMMNRAIDARSSRKGIAATPEQIEQQRVLTTKLWEDPEYRSKVTAALRDAWTNPETLRLRAEASKRHMSDPAVRERYADRLRAAWQDPEYRTKMLHVIEANQRPEVRAKMSESLRATLATPEAKEKRSKMIKRFFDDPAFREANRARMETYNIERSKEVVVDGVEYSSVRAASRITGKSRAYIKKLNGMPVPSSLQK